MTEFVNNEYIDEVFKVNNEVFYLNKLTYTQKYQFIWRRIVELSIKNNTNALDDFNSFRTGVIFGYAKSIFGEEYFNKNDGPEQIRKKINLLSQSPQGHIIEQLIYDKVTIKNVLKMSELCLELLRTYQNTTDVSWNNIKS